MGRLPTDIVRKRIAQAVALMAQGHTFTKAAAILGVTYGDLHAIRGQYADLWHLPPDESVLAGLRVPEPPKRKSLRGRHHHVGMMVPTQGRIKLIAGLFAQGCKLSEVARQLNCHPQAIRHLRNRYPEEWKKATQEALKDREPIVTRVREMAGTDAILTAPEPYFRLMSVTEQEAAAQGQASYAPTEAGGMPLLEFLRHVYLPSRIGISPGAAATLERVVRKLYRWAGRAIGVAELSDDLVNQFLLAVSSQCKPTTVNCYRAKLLALWHKAWKRRMVFDQPRDVSRSKEPKKLPVAWRVEEVAQLVRHCQKLPGMVGDVPASRWWSSLVLTLYWTGARIGAMLQAKSEDLDLAAGTLVIRAEVTKTGIEQFYRLPAECLDALAAIHDPTRALIWTWPHCHRHLWTVFRRIVEASGIRCDRGPRALFYRLRRTSLSYIAAVSIDLARQQGGHVTDAMTIKSYIDPSIAYTRSPADVLPHLLPTERSDTIGSSGRPR